MAAGRTKKPCPGCKTWPTRFDTPEDVPKGNWYDRPVDGVCRGCEALMKEGERHRKMAQMETDLEAAVMPWTYYSLDYVRGPREPFQKALVEILKRLARGERAWLKEEYTYSEELRQVLKPIFCVAPPGRGESGYRSDAPVTLFPPGTREHVHALYRAVQAIAESCYSEGHADGRRLLAALAEGSLTIEQFDDKVTRAENRG